MEHKCEICEQNYSKKQSLKEHFFESHNQNAKHFHCNICTKSYPSQKKLTFHYKATHGTQKKLKCESCSKTFSHAGNLKKHIYTIHEGCKDHKCESCNKSFSQEQSLKRHIRIRHHLTSSTKQFNLPFLSVEPFLCGHCFGELQNQFRIQYFSPFVIVKSLEFC